MLQLNAAEIRGLTHFLRCAIVVAAKLAAGAEADGEVDGRKVFLHLPNHVARPGPLL